MQKGFARDRPQPSHHAPQLADTPLIATGADHLKQAGGPEARVTLQRVAQEIQVGIGQLIPPARAAAETVTLEGRPHRLRMQTQFGGNRTDLPVLGMKPVTDLSDLFSRNHASPPRRKRIEKTAAAAAKLANHPARIPFRPERRRDFRPPASLDWRQRFSPADPRPVE